MGEFEAFSFTFYSPIFLFFIPSNLPDKYILTTKDKRSNYRSYNHLFLYFSLLFAEIGSRIAIVFGTINPYFKVDILVRGALLPWGMMSLFKLLQLPKGIPPVNVIFIDLILLYRISSILILLSSLFVGVSYLLVKIKLL